MGIIIRDYVPHEREPRDDTEIIGRLVKASLIDSVLTMYIDEAGEYDPESSCEALEQVKMSRGRDSVFAYYVLRSGDYLVCPAKTHELRKGYYTYTIPRGLYFNMPELSDNDWRIREAQALHKCEVYLLNADACKLLSSPVEPLYIMPLPEFVEKLKRRN